MLRSFPRSGVWSLLLGLLLLCWTFRYLSDIRHAVGLDESIAGSNSSISADVTRNLTVHLVMATVKNDDISWTDNINNEAIGNLTIVRYYADDETAPHHLAQNKGREASMYLTYIIEHYDRLPDLVIFTHADEHPWHVEPLLENSMSYTLSHLDLHEAQQRGYANLRVSWQNACPDWIDTTRTFAQSAKLEEPWVRQAFLDNFPTTEEQDAVDGVPRYLAQPCCSQFTVARDTLRAVPKAQYEKHLQWLLGTDLPDNISGRTWEHMFQYLWTQRAVDCPVEWKALCKMYHICFLSGEHFRNHTQLSLERAHLVQKSAQWDNAHDPEEVSQTRDRIKLIEKALGDGVKGALNRGADGQWRLSSLGDLYVD